MRRALCALLVHAYLGFPLVAGGVAACRRGSLGARRSGSSPTSEASAAPAAKSSGVPCGALSCLQYDSPRAAFLEAMAGDPLVLGIGEAHAPRGAQVASAAKRFTEDLLPLLDGRASNLLVELLLPPRGCLDAAAEVRAQHAPVVEGQAATNEREYVAMGERARGLGIVPDLLRPTCADMDAIVRAGDDAIDVSLETIARLVGSQARRLISPGLPASGDGEAGRVLVVYGGALHNDLEPDPEMARWSYAPDLYRYTQGRFIAIDLIVPEFIGDTDAWRSLAWWPVYDRARLGGRTTLFRTAEASFVLVFPETRR
jgi:hypothetical protein